MSKVEIRILKDGTNCLVHVAENLREAFAEHLAHYVIRWKPEQFTVSGFHVFTLFNEPVGVVRQVIAEF